MSSFHYGLGTFGVPDAPGFVGIALALGLLANSVRAIEDNPRQYVTTIVLGVGLSLIGQECQFPRKLQSLLDVQIRAKRHDVLPPHLS